MTVQDVWAWLDGLAPFAAQEAFDNAGLVLGNPAAEVRRVFFSLDATLPAVREAAAWQADLMVTHHPLLFGGVSSLRTDRPEGAAVAALLGAGMGLLAAHTNLDSAPGGTGDCLADALGLTAVAPITGDLYLRMGELPQALPATALLHEVNSRLHACARLYGDPAASLRRVAVGAGAYGEGWQAAAEAGAQAYVVGEIKHHELLAACATGLTVIQAGHHETEFPGIAALCRRFQTDAHSNGWQVAARLNDIPPYAVTV